MDKCRFANRSLYRYPLLDDAARRFDPAFRRRRMLAFAAGVVLLLGAAALVARLSLMSLLSIPVLVVAGGFLGYAWLSGRGNQTAFRGRVLELWPSRQVACRFFDDHFEVECDQELRHCTYADVTRWYRGRQSITLLLGDQPLVLSRDGFEDGDATAFEQFLRERV